jgi:glycogen debranching enzyme
MTDTEALDKDDRPNDRYDGRSLNEARNEIYGKLYELGLSIVETTNPGEGVNFMAPFAAWLADRENGEEV